MTVGLGSWSEVHFNPAHRLPAPTNLQHTRAHTQYYVYCKEKILLGETVSLNMNNLNAELERKRKMATWIAFLFWNVPARRTGRRDYQRSRVCELQRRAQPQRTLPDGRRHCQAATERAQCGQIRSHLQFTEAHPCASSAVGARRSWEDTQRGDWDTLWAASSRPKTNKTLYETSHPCLWTYSRRLL